MTTEILIRPARATDRDAIANFNIAMARETENIQLDSDTVRAGVQAVLEDETKGRYLLAEVAGAAVGQLMLTYEWSDWRNGMFLWIQSVYVRPESRRRGVFRKLHEYLHEHVLTIGYCGVRLYVDADNTTARRTYQQLGMSAPDYVMMETKDALRD